MSHTLLNEVGELPAAHKAYPRAVALVCNAQPRTRRHGPHLCVHTVLADFRAMRGNVSC